MSEQDTRALRRSATETTNLSLSLPNVMIQKLKEEMDERMLGSVQEAIRMILSDYFAGTWIVDLARKILEEVKH